MKYCKAKRVPVTQFTHRFTNLLIFSCLLSRWQISCNDRECPLPGEIPGESGGGSLSSTGGILHRAACTSALDSDTESSSQTHFIRRDSSLKLKSVILLSCQYQNTSCENLVEIKRDFWLMSILILHNWLLSNGMTLRGKYSLQTQMYFHFSLVSATFAFTG